MNTHILHKLSYHKVAEMWWLFILACCVCAEKQLQRPRVYLGEEDTNSEFPYVIGIQDEYGMRICTCSLIARNWILTAGHCATFDAPTMYQREESLGNYQQSITRRCWGILFDTLAMDIQEMSFQTRVIKSSLFKLAMLL
ncbi:brain-specific serine protease 4-like isoform X4 [Choristoneura fumiferana]|uniref:brain-specific serine protease 4-like isoform X4 n=1 Tax=Choristoneura fumiferana TaxID=7141 RepID=UPI003D156334